LIHFEEVALRYGTSAETLRDVSFHLEPGSFHYVVGPSGAGKSSLLKLMYLALRPTGGRISIFGRDPSELPRDELAIIRRRIGVVFQEFRLLNHLSVFQNVALPLRVTGKREPRWQAHVRELLEWVGLGEQIDADPLTLSGGEQQRVAIARAVITRPNLIIADEPTGNVDEKMAIRLMYLFEELNKVGTTIIVATHNEGLVERFPHPLMQLGNGSLEILPGPE
jgi:cell division transport system ATP-binding protein